MSNNKAKCGETHGEGDSTPGCKEEDGSGDCRGVNEFIRVIQSRKNKGLPTGLENLQPPPPDLLLTGPSGTGKSYLLHMLNKTNPE